MLSYFTADIEESFLLCKYGFFLERCEGFMDSKWIISTLLGVFVFTKSFLEMPICSLQNV